MLFYWNNNHHFLLPLCNPIVALPCCPLMIVTVPLTCGGGWWIVRFWSSRCLNFSTWLSLLLLWFWGMLKMKKCSLLSLSWNQSWKMNRPPILILLWKCMHKIYLHSRVSHSTSLSLNEMKRNPTMGWSYKLCVWYGTLWFVNYVCK